MSRAPAAGAEAGPGGHDRAAAVRTMLEARSVAVVGASPRPDRFGSRLLAEVARSPARPRLYLVNPRYDHIGERVCHPSLAAVPQPVDLVLLAVPDAALADQLQLAARRGDRSAVVFGSAVTPAGQPPLRPRLAAIARAAGMALCGGGCMGFVNPGYGLRAIGYLEPDPLPVGPVAVLTHSGSVFSTLLRSGRGFGLSLAVSSGQELVTTAADYLGYALDQPGTRVLALVLETLREPAALRRVLDRAAAADVAVVALTVGASGRGRDLVAAHSDALAGADAAWAALAEAHGVHRVADLAELADTVELFATGRRCRPAGAPGAGSATGLASGLATVHDSGAERALLADLAAAEGVALARLGAATQARLATRLDPGLAPDNPLDIWGTGTDTAMLLAFALDALAADPAVRAVALAVDLVVELDGDPSYRQAVVEAARRTGKPLVVLAGLPSALDRAAAVELRSAGVAVLEDTRSGLRALGHLMAHGPVPVDPPPPVDRGRRERWRARLAAGPVDQATGFALLADYGIPVTPAEPVSDPAAAVAAAARIGYPVVVKTDEPAVAHKTEVGGVRLGLADATAVEAAYRELAGRLGPHALVCATAPPGVELAAGLTTDPHLGPLVVVAAGGVLADLLADRAVALPPLGPGRADRLVDRLRVRGLLAGHRGRPAADRPAVAAAVAAVGTIATELGDRLAALDVNPLVCGPAGAVAADVLVVPAGADRYGPARAHRAGGPAGQNSV